MSPLLLVPGSGMILVAAGAVGYWKSRQRVPFAFFAWGIAAWILAVGLKALAALPFPALRTGLQAALPAYVAEPLLWFVTGLYTGIFECGIALGFIRHIRRLRESTWQEAVGFGIGFGAIEAFLVGAFSLGMMLLALIAPGKLPPAVAQSVSQGAAALWLLPAPVVERLNALLIHAFANLLIIHAVQRRIWKWFWASFAYKTLVDGIAGMFHISIGYPDAVTVWIAELVLLPFGVLGAWGIWKFRAKMSHR